MAADILPLGEQMVTRTPLHLHLVNHATGKACWLAPRCSECGGVAAMKAEFGGFDSGAWKPHWEQTLTDPNPTTQVPAAYQQRTYDHKLSSRVAHRRLTLYARKYTLRPSSEQETKRAFLQIRYF